MWELAIPATPLVNTDTLQLTNRVIAPVRTLALPVGLAVGLGSVWETSWSGWGAPGPVYRIDPATNTVVGESNLGFFYSNPAVAFGSVWLQGRDLLRIRPR